MQREEGRDEHMKGKITARQQAIYEFIRGSIAIGGMPPTMREIGAKFGIRSTNGVEKHLLALERSGYIGRERGKSRGITVIGGSRASDFVPLLGRVAAGVPVLSPENRESELTVDRSLFALKSSLQVFALGVRGNSMIDAHILDGDTVLVQEQAIAVDGDIVVALVDGDATVKRFFLENGRVRLQPENRTMEPMYFDGGDLRILGKVVGVMRKVS
jgi:repressor LexA